MDVFWVLPKMFNSCQLHQLGQGHLSSMWEIVMKKQKILPNPLTGTDGQLMVMAAHRYCLGRQSYIVGSCIDWLRLWWPSFEPNTQKVILRDTIEALQDKLTGSDGNHEEWKKFAQWVWAQMNEGDRLWCEQAVGHRKQPWPF